ncbi:MAG: hypothetical protein LBQ48_02395 [Oscillospiraceae bacterium]|jgi:hypothetical protein|nr:hypothetical protein [Oscillospiraceae bacterium]
MFLNHWIEIGIIAVTIVIGMVLYIRYRKKVEALDGFVGIVEEHGETERLAGHDWQAEALKELKR